MAHKLLSYRESTYLVATFKKSSNLVPTFKFRTLVPTLYVTVPTFVVRTRKVRTISSYFLKYVLIKFVYNYGLSHVRKNYLGVRCESKVERCCHNALVPGVAQPHQKVHQVLKCRTSITAAMVTLSTKRLIYENNRRPDIGAVKGTVIQNVNIFLLMFIFWNDSVPQTASIWRIFHEIKP